MVKHFRGFHAVQIPPFNVLARVLLETFFPDLYIIL